MHDVRSRRGTARPKSSRGREKAPATPTRRPDALGRLLARLRRHPHAVVSGLVVLHVLLAVLAFIPAPQPGGDNAVYLALGRSILDGGYSDVYDPVAPLHAHFPPGYPLIVAAALGIGLKPWVGLKAVIVAFSAAAVALTYLWIRRRRRPDLALGVALLVTISPGVLALSHWELSDVPGWALTTAALLAWERLPRGRTGRAALAAALTACAYLTRSAGLPLLIAALAWLVLRRRWRQLAVYAAVVLPPVLAWGAWTRAQVGYVSLITSASAYAPDQGTIGASGLLSRMWENAGLYAGRFLPTLLGGTATPLLAVLAVLVVLLAVYGWIRRLRRPGVAELWVPLYVGMLLVWNPEWAGDRLLLPLFPTLLMYAGDGVARLARLGLGTRRPAVPALAAGVLALVALPGDVAAARLGTFCTRQHAAGVEYACLEPDWQEFFAQAEYAREALPPGSVVLSRKPALFWSASGVPGRTYPLSREPAEFFRAARAAGARYVLLDRLDEVSEAYLTPILIRRPAAFCIVHTLGGSTLMGIRPDAERIADVRADPGEAEVSVPFKPCGPEYTRRP